MIWPRRSPRASPPSPVLASEPAGQPMESAGSLIAELNAGGTTIVQVTHSEENAARGRRVVQLRDGWMV